ncbi:hypothetical protein ANCCAN_01878 [Ancylostoma caninum]|uniref:EF-hand domain-containing protein n=1 Tax=Ancylostoma caninum TaxID=29170 RepID=A0A368H9R3_ANCCA|nr:hypothetical protein ANCCAN_01878 [Ancylostoma caninum]
MVTSLAPAERKLKCSGSTPFDRAVHRLYADPGRVCSNQVADRLFQRLYWALRAIQFKIFYKNEELDVDELADRLEVGVQPPSLDELARTTHFNRRWIKYMYARFKNECPSGRMREQEFRHVLAAIIAPERATDQYISRLFLAFSTDDKKTVTFQNLIECLSLIQAKTAESNALWTIRIITGCQTDRFAFPEFLSFTQAVFGLNEGKPADGYEEVIGSNKETVQQRASTIFKELDADGDGFVTLEDMTRFFEYNKTICLLFQSFEISPQTRATKPNSLPV